MRILFIILQVTLIVCYGEAQTLSLSKSFGNVRFQRDSIIISPKQVADILTENPLASSEFKNARINASIASILGFSGGLLIGIPAGTALAGGNPEWGMALGGVALIVAAIPFNQIFAKKAQHALNLYNSQAQSSSLINRTEFFIVGNGLGIKIKL